MVFDGLERSFVRWVGSRTPFDLGGEASLRWGWDRHGRQMVCSYKVLVLVVVIAAVAFGAVACDTLAPMGSSSSKKDDALSRYVREAFGVEDGGDSIDLDEDWIAAAEKSQAAAKSPTAGRAPTSYWSVVLRTFADENHTTAAANMIRSLGSITPELGSAHVQRSERGSDGRVRRVRGPRGPGGARAPSSGSRRSSSAIVRCSLGRC